MASDDDPKVHWCRLRITPTLTILTILSTLLFWIVPWIIANQDWTRPSQRFEDKILNLRFTMAWPAFGMAIACLASTPTSKKAKRWFVAGLVSGILGVVSLVWYFMFMVSMIRE